MLNADPSAYSWPGVLEFLYVRPHERSHSTRKSHSRKTCGSLRRKSSRTNSRNSRANLRHPRPWTPTSNIRTTCWSIVWGRSNLKTKLRVSRASSLKYPFLSADPSPTKPKSRSKRGITKNSLQPRGAQFAIEHKQRSKIEGAQQHPQNLVFLPKLRIPQAIH